MKAFVERCYQRVPFTAQLTVFASGGVMLSRGYAINLSRGGIGFYADDPVPADQAVKIILRTTIGGKPFEAELPATVCWCVPQEPGAIAGAEFAAVLTPETHPELCACLKGA